LAGFRTLSGYRTDTGQDYVVRRLRSGGHSRFVIRFPSPTASVPTFAPTFRSSDRSGRDQLHEGHRRLGWGPGGCKGYRGGGKPERDEQPVRVAGVSDEGHHAAAAAARASQNVLGEHPAEQLSPRQPVGTRRDGVRGTWTGSMGGVVGGRHQRAELRAGFAGRAEDPRVAHEMAPGRRDDADQPAQERDRFEHQMGAAVGPRPLELRLRWPTSRGPCGKPRAARWSA
jgi:hypothetical protein